MDMVLVFIDHWFIREKELSGSSRVEDVIVHWSLNLHVHYMLAYISCVVGVRHCYLVAETLMNHLIGLGVSLHCNLKPGAIPYCP